MTIDAFTAPNASQPTIGTLDTFTPTLNNNFGRGDKILIHTNGGSTNVSAGSGGLLTDAVLTFTFKKR